MRLAADAVRSGVAPRWRRCCRRVGGAPGGGASRRRDGQSGGGWPRRLWGVSGRAQAPPFSPPLCGVAGDRRAAAHSTRSRLGLWVAAAAAAAVATSAAAAWAVVALARRHEAGRVVTAAPRSAAVAVAMVTFPPPPPTGARWGPLPFPGVVSAVGVAARCSAWCRGRETARCGCGTLRAGRVWRS